MTVTSTIFSLFSRSPLAIIARAMSKGHECVQTLLPFFTHVLADEWEQAEQMQLKITALEHEADELKKKIKHNLPPTVLLPVNRGDLLIMADRIDGLPNKAKDIAGLTLGRHLSFPKVLAEPLINYLKRSIDASAQADEAIHELDNLLETGFYGKEVKLVEKMLETLYSIEHDTDAMQIAIRHELYLIEKELPPIEVMFMYKIFEWIGDLADRAQGIGAQLQLMLAN